MMAICLGVIATVFVIGAGIVLCFCETKNIDLD